MWGNIIIFFMVLSVNVSIWSFLFFILRGTIIGVILLLKTSHAWKVLTLYLLSYSVFIFWRMMFNLLFLKMELFMLFSGIQEIVIQECKSLQGTCYALACTSSLICIIHSLVSKKPLVGEEIPRNEGTLTSFLVADVRIHCKW